MLMDMHLPKFEIYRSISVPNCFESSTNYQCPDFFLKRFFLMWALKFTLSDVTLFLPDNLFELIKLYSGLYVIRIQIH